MEQEARSEPQGSEALKVYDKHSDNLLYLLRVILRDIEQLKDPTDAARQITAQTAAMVEDLKKDLSDSAKVSETLGQLTTNVDAMKKCSDEIGTLLETNLRLHPFLFDWMLAMMVTFAEAYLENALLLLTATHPAWMATNEKVLSSDDVLKIEATRPAEMRWQRLLEITRERWTEQFLRRKPGEWISRLEKFGAPPYRAGLAAEMTTIWNRRHAIVHARPRATSHHETGLSGSAAARFLQSKSEFEKAISVIYSFVNATDAFIVALNHQGLSSQPKQMGN